MRSTSWRLGGSAHAEVGMRLAVASLLQGAIKHLQHLTMTIVIESLLVKVMCEIHEYRVF